MVMVKVAKLDFAQNCNIFFTINNPKIDSFPSKITYKPQNLRDVTRNLCIGGSAKNRQLLHIIQNYIIQVVSSVYFQTYQKMWKNIFVYVRMPYSLRYSELTKINFVSHHFGYVHASLLFVPMFVTSSLLEEQQTSMSMTNLHGETCPRLSLTYHCTFIA